MAGLEEASALGEVVVEGRLAGTTASHGLIVGEDDGVGLGVRLVGTVENPLGVSDSLGVETSTVEGEEIKGSRALGDPGGDLATHTTTKHHTHGVEAAGVEHTTDSRLGANKGLVVRGEGLRTADGRLDTDGLDRRAADEGTLEVLAEGLPVKLEETEGKARVNGIPELGVLLVATNGHGVTLGLEVDGEIVVTDVGEATVHAGDVLSDNVGVLHGEKGKLGVNHGGDVVSPGASSVDDPLGLNAVARGGGHSGNLLGVGAGGSLGLDASDANTLKDLAADLASSLGVGGNNTGGVNGTVSGGVHTTVDVVNSDQRVDILDLAGLENVALNAVVLADLSETLVLSHTLTVGGDEETTVLSPVSGLGLDLELLAHLAGVSVELDIDIRGTKTPEHTSTVPGGTGGESILLKENGVEAALLEVVEDGGSDGATTNDNNISLGGDIGGGVAGEGSNLLLATDSTHSGALGADAALRQAASGTGKHFP